MSKPGDPTSLTVTPRNQRVYLSWTASTDGGDPAGLHYLITSSPNDFSASVTTTSVDAVPLTNGQAYTFHVQAVNSAGTSNAVASAAATPGDCLAPFLP